MAWSDPTKQGMPLGHRIKAVYWWCYMHTEHPLPPDLILERMPTDDNIDEDGELDPGLAGSWDYTFEGPMGKSNMKLLLEVDGTTLGGHMEILRKKQPIQ